VHLQDRLPSAVGNYWSARDGKDARCRSNLHRRPNLGSSSKEKTPALRSVDRVILGFRRDLDRGDPAQIESVWCRIPRNRRSPPLLTTYVLAAGYVGAPREMSHSAQYFQSKWAILLVSQESSYPQTRRPALLRRVSTTQYGRDSDESRWSRPAAIVLTCGKRDADAP
jgi:hypothetical protein